MPSQIGLLTTARTLAVDAWTAEAVRALRAAGVDVLLLKGPAIAAWLYDRGEARPYVDADLLVAPQALGRAERVLAGLGYELRDPEGERALVSGRHAQTWQRPDDLATVDLHHGLPGEVLADDVVWPALWPRAAAMPVGGAVVAVLDEPSRALMVAVHAAHHGAGVEAPLEDLRRAVRRVPVAVWAQAVLIAEHVMALPQLARGLRHLPEGAALADQLGLPARELLEILQGDAVASGFERLASARGVRARSAMLRREAIPPASFMHWWRPWSRRSRLRLAVAYGYRLGWLAVHAAPGFRAWRRARGEVRA